MVARMQLSLSSESLAASRSASISSPTPPKSWETVNCNCNRLTVHLSSSTTITTVWLQAASPSAGRRETSAVPKTLPRADGGRSRSSAGTPKHQPKKPSLSCPRRSGEGQANFAPNRGGRVVGWPHATANWPPPWEHYCNQGGSPRVKRTRTWVAKSL